MQYKHLMVESLILFNNLPGDWSKETGHNYIFL